jgi:hypothetical protein
MTTKNAAGKILTGTLRTEDIHLLTLGLLNFFADLEPVLENSESTSNATSRTIPSSGAHNFAGKNCLAFKQLHLFLGEAVFYHQLL